MLVAAEVSLCALTCAAGFGLIRLFEDGAFVPQIVASAVTAHVLASVCRRQRLHPAVTLLIGIAGLALVLSWLVLGHTTTFGLPTGETVRVGREQLREAWALFGHVRAPVPTAPGFVLAAAAGVWGLAFLADAAAFRARGLVEAMIPASTLFVFGAALGAPRSRTLCTALFFAALLSYWLFARAHRQLAAPQWMARDEHSGTTAIVRTGAAISIVAVLAAVIVGPNLPGADARAVIPWRAADRDTGSSRVTVSPLVDIRTRIVDQANVEVFQVQSSVRSYWRLTALETFDGRIWSSSRKYRRAQGRLGSNVSEKETTSVQVDQRINIENLDSIWLPAAFRPVSIKGTPARYDAESASLLTESANAIGQSYDVVSAVPRLDAAALATATGSIPEDVASTYLALPATFPPQVRALAAGVVGNAGTPYAAAKRLHDFIRSREFTYDLDVPPGHSDDALERFLFLTKRGYCEQFAGAYAAMARAVGLPSRVGVGFTTGELGPDGFYSVRGYHGHAWPEVYLSGFGWVPFEPTPGRGIPGGESYTGVPEAQAAPGSPNTATTLATTTTVTTPSQAGASTTVPRDVGDNSSPTTITSTSPWPRRLAIAAAVLVLLPAAWIGAIALARGSRRRRRRARAANAAERVVVAWQEVGDALTLVGVPSRPSETPSEYAARAARVAGLDAEALAGLAGLTTASRYAPDDELDIDDEILAQAIADAEAIEHMLTQHLDRSTRLRNAVDPRLPASR
jgi:transglutaminase-like putative cysteine protease